MKKDIILIGSGGHCSSCIDVLESAREYKIVAIVGKEEEKGRHICSYPINYTDSDLPRLIAEYRHCLIAIGQIKSCELRKKMFSALLQLKAGLPSIIAPTAYVSKYSDLGSGSIIMQQSFINTGVKIGENCIINSKALIEHDCQIADHVHISTNALLNGGCFVDEGTFIGSGSIVREGVRLGKNCIIACGAVVLKDVPDNSKVIGCWK